MTSLMIMLVFLDNSVTSKYVACYLLCYLRKKSISLKKNVLFKSLD